MFDGIAESRDENDTECQRKIKEALNHIPELVVSDVKMARCHWLDVFKGRTRLVVVNFHWYGDVETILSGHKFLLTGLCMNEDLPHIWNERRRVLRPIMKLATKSENFKGKCKLKWDALYIDGRAYTVAPKNNLKELPDVINPRKACEKSNTDTLAFFGLHSIYSNMHQAYFTDKNITYNSSEQYIQSKKAELVDDDKTQSLIMHSSNCFEIKQLGSKVKNFKRYKWESKGQRNNCECCILQV